MLDKHIISVALPPKKIYSYLPLVKDPLGLRTSGAYSILSECGQVYIGQSGWAIQVRIKERNRYIRLSQTDKSAVAEHSVNQGHIIKLKDTNIVSGKPDNLTDSSEKALNWKYTHTTLTETMAWP